MKYSCVLIGSAIGISALATSASAAPSLNVFGIADVGIGEIQNKDSAGHTLTVKQERTDGLNSSRIGFNASQDIGFDGSTVSAWFEAGLAPDSGTQTSTSATVSAAKFWNRRTTISLANPTYGELRLGRDFAPSFRNLIVFDPYGTNGVGNVNNMVSALGSGANTIVRVDNSVTYWLPKTLGGVYGELEAAVGEGATSASASQTNNKNVGLRLGWSNASFEIAGAYGDTTIDANAKKFDTAQIGAAFKAANFRLETLVERNSYLDLSQNLWQAGGTLSLGKNDLRLSYVHSKQSGVTSAGVSTDHDSSNMFALGWVFNFTPQAAIYSTYARYDNSGNAAFTPGGLGSTKGGQSNAGELGVRYSF